MTDILPLPDILSDLTPEQKEAYLRALELSRQMIKLDNRYLNPLNESVLIKEMVYQQKLNADAILGKHWIN
jgi:hypothetical protein